MQNLKTQHQSKVMTKPLIGEQQNISQKRLKFPDLKKKQLPISVHDHSQSASSNTREQLSRHQVARFS